MVFSGFDCLARHLKRMNLTDSDICVLCNQNSTMNSEHLFQCNSFNRKRQHAKDISSLYGKQEENGVKSKFLFIRNNNNNTETKIDQMKSDEISEKLQDTLENIRIRLFKHVMKLTEHRLPDKGNNLEP